MATTLGWSLLPWTQPQPSQKMDEFINPDAWTSSTGGTPSSSSSPLSSLATPASTTGGLNNGATLSTESHVATGAWGDEYARLLAVADQQSGMGLSNNEEDLANMLKEYLNPKTSTALPSSFNFDFSMPPPSTSSMSTIDPSSVFSPPSGLYFPQGTDQAFAPGGSPIAFSPSSSADTSLDVEAMIESLGDGQQQQQQATSAGQEYNLPDWSTEAATSFGMAPLAPSSTASTSQMLVGMEENEDVKPDISSFELAPAAAPPAAATTTSSKRKRAPSKKAAAASTVAAAKAAPAPVPQAAMDDASSDEEEDDHDLSTLSGRGRRASSSSSSVSGAPSKKLPKTSVLPFASATLHQTSTRSTLPPVPEWIDRPDDETYKNMSSKEKRQVRNKISARNFRHRRKEYITTLEDEISSRDTIISQLRDEITTSRDENKDLRHEVDLLKTKWEEMLARMTSSSASSSSTTNTAAPEEMSSVGLGLNLGKLKASAAAAAASTSSSNEDWPLASPSINSKKPNSSSNAIAKPNVTKDVAPTSAAARRTGAWSTMPGFGAGGFQAAVHTTLVPEFNLLSAKGASFNPNLNRLTDAQREELEASTAHLRKGGKHGADEGFMASNPYLMAGSHVEEYRSQLYAKLANNAAGWQATQQQGGKVPQGFRPAFFTQSSSVPNQGQHQQHQEGSKSNSNSPSFGRIPLHSGSSKASTSSAVFPTNEDRLEASSRATTAYIANLATQTLLGRMTSAFFEAFNGASTSSASGTTADAAGKGKMNAEKVAAVLSGKAKLAVVPVDAPSSSPLTGLEAVAERFEKLELSSSSTAAAAAAAADNGRTCGIEDVRVWKKGSGKE